MKSAKEILENIKESINKALFEETPATPAGDPAIAPEPMIYKLSDGSEIKVSALEVGGDVMIADAPAPAGTYIMEDLSSIVVGEDSKIAEIVAAPAPEDMNQPASVLPEDLSRVTPEQLRAAAQSFATGTPEERLVKLETVAKALMEYSFGWQLREAEQKALNEQAIAVYKSGFEAAEKKIEEQNGIITQLVELAEKLTEMPTGEIPTQRKVSSFSRVETGKTKLNKYAEAAQKIAEKHNS